MHVEFAKKKYFLKRKVNTIEQILRNISIFSVENSVNKHAN